MIKNYQLVKEFEKELLLQEFRESTPQERIARLGEMYEFAVKFTKYKRGAIENDPHVQMLINRADKFKKYWKRKNAGKQT